MAGNLCEWWVKMFFGFGSCRIMEFLAQQFYFREPLRFAHVKIVLLNSRGAWFQQSQQLCRSAQRRDCSKKWALWKCHNILLQRGHLLTTFHVISSLFNTKGLFKMPKILLQKYTWISHLHLFIKLLCLFKEHWVGDKDIFLFSLRPTHSEHHIVSLIYLCECIMGHSFLHTLKTCKSIRPLNISHSVPWYFTYYVKEYGGQLILSSDKLYPVVNGYPFSL